MSFFGPNMLNCACPNLISISRFVSPSPMALGNTSRTYFLARSVCPSMIPSGASSSESTSRSAAAAKSSCQRRSMAADMPLEMTVRTRWWSGRSSDSRIIGCSISSNGGRVEENVFQSRIISSICACRPGRPHVVLRRVGDGGRLADQPIVELRITASLRAEPVKVHRGVSHWHRCPPAFTECHRRDFSPLRPGLPGA